MRILILFASLLAIVPNSVLASVLAIDYGADYIKASLMKPGVPFDVLLNKDSKRKIQSSVAFKRGDRLFGQDAAYLATRFPSDTFSHLKYLTAAPIDSDPVKYFTKISAVDVKPSSRSTTNVTRSDGTEWSSEELVAMQLAYIKHLGELVAGEKVRDVIITVPAYYTQFERDAVADAVEISGLRLLALINDGTAIAVNYAMSRTFAKPEIHVIYDVGASGIRATVAEFSTTTDAKTGATGNQITTLGYGYDRTVGGIEIDRRLREILADAFTAKHKGKDIRKDKRGMAKLWKEAQRVKMILSANNEAMSQVESLAWDLDFKSKIKRSTLEAACADLEPKFTQPLYDALASAGLELSNITTVILAGGASRTPMIQNAVKQAVPADQISFNVNADEAAVLGAALHGASISRQFKTKNIKITDILVHDVQASYFAALSTPNSRPRSISTTLFPAGSKVGTKKTMTFKRKDDFIINFDYKKEPVPGFPTRMLEVEIAGVADALTNLTDSGAIDPVIKATVTLSESGFISVSNAFAYGEIKDDSFTGKLKGLFGGSSSNEESDSTEDIPPRNTVSASASATSSSSRRRREKKKVTGPVEIPLTVTPQFTTIPPMSVEQKKAARDRLRAVDAEENAKSRREEARNTFESYLYRLRDLISDEDKDKPFKKCSQASEREAIEKLLEESFEWLNDRGDLAETSQLLNKRIALETLEKPIIHRYQEIEAFPQALNNSQMWNWHTRMFLTDARQNITEEAKLDLPSKWTKEELDGLEKSLREHEAWLSEWVEKQKSVKSNEDPVIETREMKARAKVLEQHLQRLYNRKVPKSVKKKVVVEEKKNESKVEQEGEKEEPLQYDGEEQVPLGKGEARPHDEL
ncbi:Hsp70 protein-domain-containing protein [Ephemerocybe angulata]|uniref:Hsp70 protein-domain-containing protein n=1 Tax=Ephemerocybe angulata TaxID=980116 RepID=A0A8H6M2V7_9AGAR|nr:Hsp70 protein-domain-containing protein [Tulosesus angulatus]